MVRDRVTGVAGAEHEGSPASEPDGATASFAREARALGRGPSFKGIGREPIRPVAVVLALVVFVAGAAGIGYGLKHSRKHRFAADMRAMRGGSSQDDDGDDDDDPSQVDVVYVGDAGDAPEPRRTGKAAYRRVHPTIMVRLPRFGPAQGLIPDDAAGHALYRWLAAFIQSDAAALEQAVPNKAAGATVDALLALRFKTGGLRLLSATEIAPGVMVFRLEDQTPDAGELLGTLVVRPGSTELQSFALREVPAAPAKPTKAQ